MARFQDASRDEVEGKAETLEELGVDGYLAQKDAPKNATVM